MTYGEISSFHELLIKNKKFHSAVGGVCVAHPR